MHPIDDMTVFVRVVDCQGLSKAGRELRMTTAVVSSRIARLEQRLDVRLLNRTTRRVSPTEEGHLYYQHCLRIIAEINNAELALAEFKKRPAGILKVSVPVTLGRKLIAPEIPNFIRDNPDIQFRLQATDRVVDLIEEEIDVAIRKGFQPPSSLIMRAIAPDLRIVCGAPAYFEKHGIPETPEDLKRHNCLLLRFPGSRRYYWQFADKTGNINNMHVLGAMDSDSSDVLINWALAGHGLIMKSVWDVYPYLAEGNLLAVLTDFAAKNLKISVLMPPRRPQPRKTRAFVDHLVDYFAKLPAEKYTKISELPKP